MQVMHPDICVALRPSKQGKCRVHRYPAACQCAFLMQVHYFSLGFLDQQSELDMRASSFKRVNLPS